jgi:hypothetical protein
MFPSATINNNKVLVFSEAESFKHVKIKYPTHMKMAM